MKKIIQKVIKVKIAVNEANMLAREWLKQVCGREGKSDFSLCGEDLNEEVTFGPGPADRKSVV